MLRNKKTINNFITTRMFYRLPSTTALNDLFKISLYSIPGFNRTIIFRREGLPQNSFNLLRDVVGVHFKDFIKPYNPDNNNLAFKLEFSLGNIKSTNQYVNYLTTLSHPKYANLYSQHSYELLFYEVEFETLFYLKYNNLKKLNDLRCDYELVPTLLCNLLDDTCVLL
jgi:hypothetical protein